MPSDDAKKIHENYTKIIDSIEKLAEAAGRQKQDIRLIGVSKGQPIEKIRALVDAGHVDFGENYLQELEGKALALEKEAKVQWHFIGHIQSNKIRKIVSLCHEIHTVSSLKHAKKIASAARELGKAPFPVYLAVNISGDPQKSGCQKGEVLELVAALSGMEELSFQGLMAVPSKVSQKEEGLPEQFMAMKSLASKAGAKRLSLGMSQDMAYAIQAGSTDLRIGSALFGPRSYPAK